MSDFSEMTCAERRFLVPRELRVEEDLHPRHRRQALPP